MQNTLYRAAQCAGEFNYLGAYGIIIIIVGNYYLLINDKNWHYRINWKIYSHCQAAQVGTTKRIDT
jgi:hypothetical protein